MPLEPGSCHPATLTPARSRATKPTAPDLLIAVESAPLIHQEGFRSSTMRLVLVRFSLFFTPQQLAVFVCPTTRGCVEGGDRPVHLLWL